MSVLVMFHIKFFPQLFVFVAVCKNAFSIRLDLEISVVPEGLNDILAITGLEQNEIFEIFSICIEANGVTPIKFVFNGVTSVSDQEKLYIHG